MYSRLFRKTFRVDVERVLDDRNKAMLEQIRHAGAGATAMHVRRGDLSAYNPVYGSAPFPGNILLSDRNSSGSIFPRP